MDHYDLRAAPIGRSYTGFRRHRDKITHIMLQDEITWHMNKIEAATKKPGTKHQLTNKQS